MSRCSVCNGSDFGTKDNKVTIKMPESWETQRESRLFDVDSCMVPELKRLWDLGVRTIECCCGHGKVDGYIIVLEKHIDIMKSDGYELLYDDRVDLFKYPKQDKKEKAVDYLKARGINNIDELAEITGMTPRRLSDWWHNEKRAFKLLVDGWRYQNL